MSANTKQALNAEEFRAALDAVLSSEKFKSSPKLSAFLSYVVGRTVDGEADKIKGYAIAVDALGSPETFDADSNPTVRVIAGRVRKALDTYYEIDGSADDFVIHLPKGSYVPQLISREEYKADYTRPERGAPRWSKAGRGAVIAIAVSSYSVAVVLVTAAVITGLACAGCSDRISVEGLFGPSPEFELHLEPSSRCS